MPVGLGLVNAPSNTSSADAQNQSILQGKQNEVIYSNLHGKYYNQSYRTNAFWGSTAIGGLTLTLVTNTTNVGLTIWNPQGSGKNLSLISVTVGLTTAATTASAFGYGFVTNAGSGVSTAGPLSAFTPITATRGSNVINWTGQGNSIALLGGGATYTAAPTFYRTMGCGVGTVAITAPSQQFLAREDFDGTAIIPPGTVFIVGNTVLSGSTGTSVSAYWEEIAL